MQLRSRIYKFFLVMLIGLFMSIAQAENFQQTGKTVDDSIITTKVKLLFTKDKLINPFDIQVVTEGGKVILTGHVNTDMEYERAVTLAESVEGVADVKTTNLTVKDSKQPIDDIFITGKVKGKLLNEKFFGDKEIEYWPIKIETKNGVVYLAGNVENDQQKMNIIGIVKSVSGVQSVEDNIVVSAEENSI